MESESYYTTDSDIAYIRVRSPHGPVRSDEQPWGLRDYDEQTGDLVGLEVWSASRCSPRSSSLRSHAWKGTARASSVSRPDDDAAGTEADSVPP
jgi:uncharacterized protein YuzE